MKPITYNTASLPALWWLNPWLHARALHKAAGALTSAFIETDDKLTIAKAAFQNAKVVIAQRDRQIATLKAQLAEYREARNGDK